MSLEFELACNKVAVQHINPIAMETPFIFENKTEILEINSIK